MAALKYKEEHNKVGYILKPTGSDDYHQIIDFLSASHIRYALTTNPIIFDSLVKQFWSTATLRAPELGPPAILAKIDKTPYTITEELVRSRLQLADGGGIADLPIPEIYSGMDNLGYAHPMPLLPAMLLQAQAGGGAEVAEQAVPHPMPAPDQSLAHLPTPSRSQTSDPVAPVLENDHSSDQHETVASSFPTREDAPLGGNFHTSPLRSSHAPPAGQPSRGAKDPIALIALSSVVSTLVQKMHPLEAELHAHKKLFKDIMGNVPTAGPPGTFGLPPTRSSIPPGAFDAPSGALTILPGTSAVPAATLAVPDDSLAVPADSRNVPVGVSSKGKSPMVDDNIPIKARIFRQMEEDRLGEEAAKRLHDEEMAQMESERAEAQRKRQQDVLDSAMYYNESDWLNIRAQVEANASLSKTLLGDDVSEDNFPARIAALIKKKRQARAEQLFKERQNRPMTPAQQKAYMRQYVKNQRSAIYNTGWTMAYVKSFFDEQLKQEFEKIHKVQSHSQIQAFSRTLKRPGPVLDEPSTKRPKSPKVPTPSMPEVTISPVVTSPPSSRTRRKSLGRKHIHKPKSTLPKLDLDAPAQTFLKVVVNEDSDDEDFVDEVSSAVVGWEVLPTPLGEINALYRIDGSTKHFATLRQILHMVDQQDLMGQGFLCLVKSTYVGDTKLAVVHSFKCSCVGDSFWVFNSPMLYFLRVEMVINSPWIMTILGTKELASPEQTATEFSLTLFKHQSSRYVVPTSRVIVPSGRVIVATDRYVVPAGFPAQSVRSSNAYALDSLYLIVLNTKTSQSRQHDMSESDSYYLSD
uniref:JmjC domain-containing protein n=1 Tax=Tanacetum cinerariifolium TaxID=118510 RepID=A0A6L2J9F4_TANCI|nr:JmjC domain-containing protein [Tanacetum cinerariifolium]